MTLDQLRIFIAVAEALNMTRAAETLHLTQPSVSAAVAALEGRHGLLLFNRVGRGLELSEAGRAFLPEARAVLARAAEAAGTLDDLAGLKRGQLRLAASQTVATYWLPVRMARFAARWPGVALSLAVGNTQEAAALVLAGEADLGFVEGETEAPLLARRPIGADRLGLYARPDHPLALHAEARRPLAPAELASAAWVLREAGSGTRAHFEDALAAAGLAPAALDIRLELPSNGAVLEALAAGALVGAVSELAAGARVAAGQIVRLDWPLPARRFTLLTHRARRASRAVQAFQELLD
ncbi:MAG TPA: LysR substrate-binding domain-containing protein [Novosphingobium sp.]|nr:LysR substrate-binding domain-containing protein [Novosphingobium sp.]HZV09425.1 LysR substrate-binding domain-containing protein [Novosphingobium sp.]